MNTAESVPVELENTPSTLEQPELRSGAALIASAPRAVQDAFLDGLSEQEMSALPFLFDFWAHPHQLPPQVDWRSWVIMGGRGAGKTRAGAEWVRMMVEGNMPGDAGRARRVALVGETFDQVRDVMIFGDSGILACSPPDRRPEWQATRRRLVWPNGAVAEAHSASSPEHMRGPQFDAAWVDEIGCAAINKAPNEPNKFLDPKSSESAIPHFSSGKRDDYVQMQYLRAYYGFFGESENNPESSLYDGPMVDMSRAFVWAWDARPWPNFPSDLSIWSDGQNHVTGHWLTGRTSVMPLAHVVGEICESVSFIDYDATNLHGIVRGFSVADFDTPRAALQPLMIALGFDAIERGGKIVFQTRKDASEHGVSDAELVVNSGDATLEKVRAPMAEVVGEVRLGYVEAEGEFVARIADARFPHDGTSDVTQNELPLALTEAEATTIAERWLSEARVSRDAVSFSLPPSRSDLRAGDLAELTDARGDTTLYRVDRIEDRGARRIEAVRVERHIYTPSEAVETVGEVRPFAVPVPVVAQFMDLPLLKGDEVAHAPYVAAFARPWPGGVAVYGSSEDSGYDLNSVIEQPSRIGVLETPLLAAKAGIWQRGEPLRVKISGAPLSSVTREAVLNGTNVAAIGDGSSDNWEIIQFAQANLVGTDMFDLSDLLRGQAGSDGLIPELWPAGSRIVMLDGGPAQITAQLSNRGLARHYRIGPSLRPYDDPSYRYYVEAFQGIGLRPYAPTRLKAHNTGSDLALSWIRRTRIDGDSWASVEVPLGEEVERYLVRISQGGSVKREIETATPSWIYSSAAQAADGLTGPYDIEVAQVSLRFGPGLFSRIEING
ncbi:phage tail protein [Litoreibacter janthinus]|uniref:Terminase-like family protein n=1 Tax=Litoreibacter janthinus TaxID=670154 RepID=A0A1I6HAP4_9RHOB|nr:phage tail protein [Litoreibacter janthinus]SFR51559.1 Terminase-like family protein [Litoreibacter janthinus]